jgi:hypothetical protein
MELGEQTLPDGISSIPDGPQNPTEAAVQVWSHCDEMLMDNRFTGGGLCDAPAALAEFTLCERESRSRDATLSPVKKAELRELVVPPHDASVGGPGLVRLDWSWKDGGMGYPLDWGDLAFGTSAFAMCIGFRENFKNSHQYPHIYKVWPWKIFKNSHHQRLVYLTSLASHTSLYNIYDSVPVQYTI